MRSSRKCIPSSPPVVPDEPAPLDRDSIELNPEVCVFRHVALLHVPKLYRAPLRHLGNLLFDGSMEIFGIAGEEPDSEAIAARRLEALAEDLETAGRQLASMSLEDEGAEISRAEQAMCDQAGHLAPAVLHLAARLRKAAALRQAVGER